MIKPTTITQWLMQPARFSDKDRKEAAALIKTYPYFVPTRYVEASEHHKKQPFAPALLNMMHLYMGNWLLFHEYLQTAAGKQAAAAIPIPDDVEDDDLEIVPDDTDDDFEYDDQITTASEDFGTYEDESVEVLLEDKSVDQIIAEEILEEEEPFALAEEAKPKETPAPPREAATPKEKQPAPAQAAKPAADTTEKPVSQPTPSTQAEAAPAPKTEPVTVQEAPEAAQPAPPEVTAAAPEPVAQTTEAPEPKEPVAKKEPAEKKKDEIPLFYQHRKNDSLIQPIYTEDYFLHQGLHVSDELPKDHKQKQADKSLMVVMSFSEWLIHFKTKGEREKEEQEDQKALKTMWQKEKLAAALEEENEEIPETVFEMAVNSITKEEDLASEPLAEIMVKQGKHDKAIDMYRKLSLRNPQKKTYFARKIDELQKEKGS